MLGVGGHGGLKVTPENLLTVAMVHEECGDKGRGGLAVGPSCGDQ